MAEVFQLPAELTIYNVGATRDDLLVWLAQAVGPGESVEIDASRVDELDGAGVQLLGALTVALTQREATWCIKEPSAQFLEICRVLGSQSWLQIGEEVGASA